MSKLLLLFSHTLTEEQKTDAHNLGIDEYIYLPDDLQDKWSNVNPEITTLYDYTQDFKDFLIQNTDKNDYVLIQGDFGLVHIMVNFCFANNLIPIYATTERIAKEIRHESGEIEVKKIFKHKIFRRYENE